MDETTRAEQAGIDAHSKLIDLLKKTRKYSLSGSKHELV